MSSIIVAVIGTAATFALAGGDAGFDRGCCCCPCPCTVSPCVPSEAAPPTPPVEGETQESQSVEPAAPPVAPQTGTTSRSNSYQPAPVYRSAPTQSFRSQSLDPVERRQHPSNRLMGPRN